MFPEILYEDNHILAVDKPAGLLTQGDISRSPSLLGELKTYIKQRDSKPGNVFLGMVQRLDRPVSGAIIFAKTSKAASRLSEQIRRHQVEKVYIAVSDSLDDMYRDYGEWQEIRHYLVRSGSQTLVAECSDENSKLAILRIKQLYGNDHNSFNMIRLVTGRKHQIRAQLSYLGYPVSGDRKYGSKTKSLVKEGIGLHAYYCAVKHPVKPELLEVKAEVPKALLHPFSSEEKALILNALDWEIANLVKD